MLRLTQMIIPATAVSMILSLASVANALSQPTFPGSSTTDNHAAFKTVPSIPGLSKVTSTIQPYSTQPLVQVAELSDPVASTITETSEVSDLHDQWLAGAPAAAKQYGCTNIVVEQQPDETISDALNLFAETATEGECLVLAPLSTNLRATHYSFANGGKVNGVDILYISDLPQARIWNAASLTQ